MLAKITSKNQLTLPKSITQSIGPVEYFDVATTQVVDPDGGVNEVQREGRY